MSKSYSCELPDIKSFQKFDDFIKCFNKMRFLKSSHVQSPLNAGYKCYGTIY